MKFLHVKVHIKASGFFFMHGIYPFDYFQKHGLKMNVIGLQTNFFFNFYIGFTEGFGIFVFSQRKLNPHCIFAVRDTNNKHKHAAKNLYLEFNFKVSYTF